MDNAPLTFRISLPGQKTFAIALSRFNEEISDWRPFWNDYFVPAWYRHETVHYETQGSSTGDQWAALTERYAAWKQKHWPGIPTGVLSGATRESLTVPGDENAILNISKEKFEIGTRVPYAIYLQMGTRRMPARPPMRVNQEFMVLCGRLLQEFGHDTMRKSGLA